jgi:hypothetical protein
MSYLFYAVIFCAFSVSFSLQTFEGLDASCLLRCVGQEQLVNDTLTDRDFCDVLFGAYYLCNSFDIATARCQRHSQCRQECTIEQWCYFGTGLIANCQGDIWHNISGSGLEFYTDCLTAEAAYTEDSNKPNDISAGARLQTIALIIVVGKKPLLTVVAP